MKSAELTIIGLLAQTPSARQARGPSKSTAELRQEWFQAVVRECNPTGFAETMLAREVARCGAQMILGEQRLEAIETHAEQALRQAIALPGDEIPSAIPPLNIAQICAPERLASLSRAADRNSQAFFHALRQLLDLQRDRKSSRNFLQDRDSRFATETQCLAYLARRIRLGDEPCRRCGQAGGGCWIAVRRCWECSACHAQTCIRHATVMAGSHVPLVNWFQAIRIVLHYPRISASSLATAIDIGRVPTARSMLRKIQAALPASNASQLLADLDTAYLPAT